MEMGMGVLHYLKRTVRLIDWLIGDHITNNSQAS